MIEKEFDECLRSIVQMNYGLVLISHSTDKTFTDENGQEYNQIVPTLDKRATKIVTRMVDIIGYSKAVQDEEGNTHTRLYMRGTPRYLAGSRFRYTPNYIDFTYENLVKAIRDAIDKQAEIEKAEYFTDERDNLYQDSTEQLDFDELIKSFNNLISSIAEKVDDNVFATFWQPRIIQITDKYLGKGQKVNDCSREQIEVLDLIVTDLKDLIEQNLT